MPGWVASGADRGKNVSLAGLLPDPNETWAPITSGSWKGRTLPEVVLSDPVWF